MLEIPTRGFGRSVSTHNVDLDVMCDWVEASVLFTGDAISQRDFVDSLCEGNVYADQSMAAERVSDAWTLLRKRHRSVGSGSPYRFKSMRLGLKVRDWKAAPAHSFCVLLSLSKWYRDWARQFGSDYGEQGELFELLTEVSMDVLFEGWEVRRTGWSRTNSGKLNSVVADVAGCLGEANMKSTKWTRPEANEAGLDLLCYRTFSDNRVGKPVFLVQCASGGDWEGKLHTPRLELWRKLIDFTAFGVATKGFATPYAFLDDDFARNANLVDGLLLDRYRLLAAARRKEHWIPKTLADRLIGWMRPRVDVLPVM